MRRACACLPVVFLLSGLLVAAAPAHGLDPDAPGYSPTPPDTYSRRTYPQIVRLSLVEGDVRITRGKAVEKTTGALWEKAATGLPIEAGFSLVTGTDGRAEIELEDSSTLYLAPDSVLVFNELTTTAGVPRTDAGLLSGMATMELKATIPGEYLILRTPVDFVESHYPEHGRLRINSYLDAIAFTAQEDTSLIVSQSGRRQKLVKGQTVTVHNGHRIIAATQPDPEAASAWDAWVAQRIAQRDHETASVMRSLGLTQPVPGLADLAGQGRFFVCQPYGMCWEPTNGWTAPQPAQSLQLASLELPARPGAQSLATDASMRQTGSPDALGSPGESSAAPNAPAASPQSSAQPSAQPMGQSSGQSSGQPGIGPPIYRTVEDDFPCSPERIVSLLAIDPVTHRQRVVRRDTYFDSFPYDWAVCHAGTWINRNHHYLWVAGHKRHHHPPIHWVKYAGTKAYVPIHPHDVAGKPPINLKYGVYAPRKGESTQLLAFDAARPLKLLAEAPKEFDKAYFPALAHADAPHPVARAAGDATWTGRPPANPTGKPTARQLALNDFIAKNAAVPISFDHKTQSFSIAHQVMQGGRSTTVVQSFGGAPARAGYSTAAASFAGRSDFAGGGRSDSGGGSARGFSSGGSSYSGGGGAHTGGGGGGTSGGGASGGGGGGGGGGHR